jgi:hypothetical protein
MPGSDVSLQLPAEITVSGQRYSVRVVDYIPGESMIGHTEHHMQVITIQASVSEDVARDTLLHETLHAIEAVGHIEIGEKIIDSLATILLDTLRRNPALVVALLS